MKTMSLSSLKIMKKSPITEYSDLGHRQDNRLFANVKV